MIHAPEDGKRKIGEVTDNSLPPKPAGICGPSKNLEERGAVGEEFSGNLSQSSTSFLDVSQNKKYTNSTMCQNTIGATTSPDDLQPPAKIMRTGNNQNERIAAVPEKQTQQKTAPRDTANKSEDGRRESGQESPNQDWSKHNTSATPSNEPPKKNLHNQALNVNLQHYYPQQMISSAGSTGVTTMLLNTSTAAGVPPAYVLSTQGVVGHHPPPMFLGQHPHQFPHQLHQQPNYPHQQLHNIAVGGNITVGGGAPPPAPNQIPPPRKEDALAAATDIERKDVTCSTKDTLSASAMPSRPGAAHICPSPAVSNEVSLLTHQKQLHIPPGQFEAGQEMLESVRHASLGNMQQGFLPQAVGSAIPNQQGSSIPSCNGTGAVLSYGPAPVSTMAMHNSQIIGGPTTLMQPQPNYEMVVMPTYQPQLVAVAPTLGYPQMVPSQTNPAIVALPPYAIDQTALCGMAPAPTFGHPGATYFTHPGSTMAHAMPATYFPGSQMQAYPTPAYPIMNSYPSPCLSSFPTNGALSLPPGAVGIHGQHHQQQVFNMNGSNQEIMYPTLSSQACNPTPSNTASQGNINTTNSQGNQTATKNKNSDDKDTAVDTYKKPPRRRRVVKRFEERFRDLMKFKDRYGHCDVPHKWKEDLSLGKWCSNIRISYKSVMKGDKPAIHILPGQIQRLNDEGFKWSFKRCV